MRVKRGVSYISRDSIPFLKELGWTGMHSRRWWRRGYKQDRAEPFNVFLRTNTQPCVLSNKKGMYATRSLWIRR